VEQCRAVSCGNGRRALAGSRSTSIAAGVDRHLPGGKRAGKRNNRTGAAFFAAACGFAVPCGRALQGSTLICFAGFKNERFSLAGDITYKTKPELVESRDAWGLSTTGAIKIVKNTEIFGRYDYSATIDRSGEFLMPEEYLHDYNFAVAGFQYTLSESVKLALDYQGTYETRQGNKVSDAIYLNALFKF
jgi:hypothetical protein